MNDAVSISTGGLALEVVKQRDEALRDLANAMDLLRRVFAYSSRPYWPQELFDQVDDALDRYDAGAAKSDGPEA